MAGYSGRNSVLNRIAIGGAELDGGNMKAIEAMFKQLPKQVSQDKVWAKFWRLNTKPLVRAAQNNAPLMKPGKYGRVGVPYPPDPSLTISRGTLKKSIGFFRTRDSKKHLGAYIGPKVKGKFKKNKGGYFGAWVEYGSEVMHYGKFKSKNQPFMKDAWSSEHRKVLATGFKDSEKIFAREMKIYEKTMQKYGKLGY